MSIFYFAISHPVNFNQELAARETWASKINITWYSTVPSFSDTVIAFAEPNTYANIFERVLKVWSHVNRVQQGYDWYVRLWPDNYVFSERLETVLKTLNPEIPQIVGRTRDFMGTTYVEGGAGCALSRTGFDKWIEQHGLSLTGCKIPIWLPEEDSYAEDVITSNCLRGAGVRFTDRSDTFLSHSLGLEAIENVSVKELADGTVSIGTLHYITATQMMSIWREELCVSHFSFPSVHLWFRVVGLRRALRLLSALRALTRSHNTG